MSEHVILVACTVKADSPHEAMTLLGESLNAARTRHPEITSWWIAQDDRNDGSDCNSAVFVKGGCAREAARLLHENHLTSIHNVPEPVKLDDMDPVLRNICVEESSLFRRLGNERIARDDRYQMISRAMSEIDLMSFIMNVIDNELQVFPKHVSSDIFESMSAKLHMHCEDDEQAFQNYLYSNGESLFMFDELVFTTRMVMDLLMYVAEQWRTGNIDMMRKTNDLIANLGLIPVLEEA